MEKRTRTAAVVLAALALAVLGFAGCETESRRVRDVVLPEVDLSRVEDGSYRGEVVYRETPYRLEVRVEDHRISGLEVLASEGDEHDQAALAVLERVIARQSLSVDAVSGATRSSKLYLIAAYQALTGEKVGY